MKGIYLTQEIKPTYTTFEQSKLLKEKGFKSKSRYYDGSGKLVEPPDIPENDYRHTNNEMQRFRWEAPEQHVVVEWLRVNHGIWVYVKRCCEIRNNEAFDKFQPIIEFIPQIKFDITDLPTFDSPQEAYSAAFDYVLNNLI